MRILFRTDASDAIGTGHVMRCVALAEQLSGRGHDVALAMRQLPGSLLSRVGGTGLRVVSLPWNPGMPAPAHGSLGVSSAVDAKDTLGAATGEWDWVVVDHYGIDRSWEEQVRGDNGRIAVIDDLASLTHDADLLVNPAFPEDAARYADLVPPSAQVCSGPSYALLDRSFRQAGHSAGGIAPRWLDHGPAHDGMAHGGNRLLAYFGGSDSTDLTRRTLRALMRPDLTQLEATVVLGSNYRYSDAARSLAASRAGLAVVPSQQSLAPLLRWSTMAIGAGGTSSWERLCLGIPSVVVSLAPNQEASSAALGAMGLIRYLGPEAEVTEEEIAAELAALMTAQTHVRSDLGQALVDGLGALRVAELMDPTLEPHLRLRTASATDVGRYFVWANDPQVRMSSFSPESIPWDVHRAWFVDRLNRATSQMYVLEAQGLPIGQARFDFSGEQAELDYSLDPAFRGRGWGRVLIDRAVRAVRSTSTKRITARVRLENERSISVLQSCGFCISIRRPHDVTLELR